VRSFTMAVAWYTGSIVGREPRMTVHIGIPALRGVMLVAKGLRLLCGCSYQVTAL
jgi:hypothetical protein